MSDLEAKFKDWARRFWWLRGALGAMALTSIVPNFMDLGRYEFLRAIHAIVFGWDFAAEAIGRLIGLIPFVPEFSTAAVNLIIYYSTVSIPSIVASSKLRSIPADFDYKKNRGILYKFFKFVKKYNLGYLINSNYLFSFFILLAPLYVFFPEIIMPNTHPNSFLITTYLVLLIVNTVVLIGISILKLPGFGKGIVFVLTFFICVEALYLLEAPFIADQINHFACEAMEVPPDDCDASS